MEQYHVCSNRNGPYGELPNQLSTTFLGVRSKDECEIKCTDTSAGGIMDVVGCCSFRELLWAVFCTWYPYSIAERMEQITPKYMGHFASNCIKTGKIDLKISSLLLSKNFYNIYKLLSNINSIFQ